MAPMFADGNFEHNLALTNEISAVAQQVGCTNGQLALAWLYHHAEQISSNSSKKLTAIPIPGTTSSKHLQENLQAKSIALSPVVMDEINSILNRFSVRGDRYAHMAMTFHGNL